MTILMIHMKAMNQMCIQKSMSTQISRAVNAKSLSP